MVPAGAHVEVEGFRGSCLEKCVLEVTEGSDGPGFGYAELAIDLAEGTKLVAVRVLACGADSLAVMDDHLLCKGCTAGAGRGLHLPGIVAVKELPFSIGIDECTRVSLAAVSFVILAVGDMVACDVAVAEGVGECACEAGFGTEEYVLVLPGRHRTADEVNPAELRAEYEEPASVSPYHQMSFGLWMALYRCFLCGNAGLAFSVRHEEERQGMDCEQQAPATDEEEDVQGIV